MAEGHSGRGQEKFFFRNITPLPSYHLSKIKRSPASRTLMQGTSRVSDLFRSGGKNSQFLFVMSSLPSDEDAKKRAQPYVFTIHNYDKWWDTCSTEDGMRKLAHIMGGEDVKYCGFGLEIAPTTLSPHFQGFIYFSSLKAKKQCIKVLQKLDPSWPWVQIKSIKSTFADNTAYINKDAKVFQFGTMPLDQVEKGAKSKANFRAVITKAQESDFDWIIDNEPALFLRHHGAIKSIAKDNMRNVPTLSQHQVYYLHGSSGSGKSYLGRNLGYEFYDKGLNKWFDGYKEAQHTIMLIEELDPQNVPNLAVFLKRWTDVYPFTGEDKNGYRLMRPKWIFITSQYSINELCGPDTKLYDALDRRCTQFEVTVANRELLRLSIKSHIDGIEHPRPPLSEMLSASIDLSGTPEIDTWDLEPSSLQSGLHSPQHGSVPLQEFDEKEAPSDFPFLDASFSKSNFVDRWVANIRHSGVDSLLEYAYDSDTDADDSYVDDGYASEPQQ